MFEVRRIKLGGRLRQLTSPGEELQQRLHAAEPGELAQLREKIVVVELIALELLLKSLGFGLVDLRRRPFDQRHHVAHAEDASGHAFRMEYLEVLRFLPGADEFDRDLRDLTDRQRSSAPGVAIQFGQYESGEAQRLVEVFRHRHRLLSQRRVGDQKHFAGIHRLPDAHQLLDHRVVDLEPPRGIDDHGVETLVRRGRHGVLDDRRHIDARAFRVHRHADPAPQRLQLVDGRRSVDVSGDQHDLAPGFLEMQREFSRRGGLAAAVETGQHHDRRRTFQLQLRGFGTEQFDQPVVDHLDHLLPRSDARKHLPAHAVGGDLGDEIRRHFQVHVRFEQRRPDLPHRFGDVGLGETAFSAQTLQHVMKTIAEGVKHKPFPKRKSFRLRRAGPGRRSSRRPSERGRASQEYTSSSGCGDPAAPLTHMPSAPHWRRPGSTGRSPSVSFSFYYLTIHIKIKIMA